MREFKGSTKCRACAEIEPKWNLQDLSEITNPKNLKVDLEMYTDSM